MHAATLERLASILKRELDAEDVHITSDAEEPNPATTLSWDLGRGRMLVLTFSTPPLDLQEKRARLAALIESFADLFAEAAPELPRSRPEPTITLQSELNALAGRAHASCAIIIDAKSPVVWSASEAPTNTEDAPLDAQIHDAFTHAKEIGISWRALLARPPGPLALRERKESKSVAESGRMLRLVPPVDELAGLTPSEREIIAQCAKLGRSAIARVRANAILPQLHRGEHLHEAVLDESVGYLARSFATIYVLILVFPGPFDELGAERAVTRALPIIERLVISLPPDDSPDSPGTPNGAVVALRPRRR
jgi:hypothetical protein